MNGATPPAENGAAPPPEVTDVTEVAPDTAPWAVKSMPLQARDLALAAAKRRRVNVGEFLDAAIRREILAERQPPATLGEILAPVSASLPALPDMRAGDVIDLLGEAIALAERLAGLRKDGRPPRKLVLLIERRMVALLSDHG